MTDPRTGAAPLPWSEAAPPDADIVIVGGGFSALATLMHLLRLKPAARIVVIEKSPRSAPGVAYGACDPRHLLNVPAARMGIFDDDPAAFHRWLESRDPGRYSADDFAPRALFGRYLLDQLAAALVAARQPPRFVRGEVSGIQRDAGAWRVSGNDRPALRAGAVLLAPGLPGSTPPWPGATASASIAGVVADPWATGAFAGIEPDADVMILGSGLTAIDATDALRRQGHRGVIHLVSRNGRLPLPHAPPGNAIAMRSWDYFQGNPREVLRVLRGLARQQAAAGLPWQSALDAIRPHVTPLWQSWTGPQRQQFLRHARPLWEIHRHRAPTSALDNMSAQLAAGRLTLRRGQVQQVLAGDADGLQITLRHPDGSRSEQRVARLFNCTGPTTDLRRTNNPLLRNLLQSGCASIDELALGLRADVNGALLSADGVAQAGLLLVGSLRRGELWESTAVPELRLQCERAARALVAGLPPTVAS